MACVTADHAEYITLWMNNYPRRLLGWASPRRPHGRRMRRNGDKISRLDL